MTKRKREKEKKLAKHLLQQEQRVWVGELIRWKLPIHDINPSSNPNLLAMPSAI
ncbi:ser thr kinase involved in transcription and stress response [Sesbania bispinosa]|nr:ser thr kinase involved in transcription and stress response [Sesbania bispinosa]